MYSSARTAATTLLISVRAFWDSLIRHFRAGSLLSIDKVRDELLDVSKREDEEPDGLYYWTKDSPRDLFVSSGEQAVVDIYKDVIAWVYSSPQFYRGARRICQKSGWMACRLHPST